MFPCTVHMLWNAKVTGYNFAHKPQTAHVEFALPRPLHPCSSHPLCSPQAQAHEKRNAVPPDMVHWHEPLMMSVQSPSAKLAKAALARVS